MSHRRSLKECAYGDSGERWAEGENSVAVRGDDEAMPQLMKTNEDKNQLNLCLVIKLQTINILYHNKFSG